MYQGAFIHLPQRELNILLNWLKDGKQGALVFKAVNHVTAPIIKGVEIPAAYPEDVYVKLLESWYAAGRGCDLLLQPGKDGQTIGVMPTEKPS